MTEAVSAQGVQLGVDIEGDGNYTWFAEVKSVPEIGESADKLDATHLTSVMHEYIKDIPDYSSDLSFTMNAMPSGATDSNLDLLMSLSKDSKYAWQIKYPQLNTTVSFDATFTWSLGGAEVSSVQEITLNLIPATETIVETGVMDLSVTFHDMED